MYYTTERDGTTILNPPFDTLRQILESLDDDGDPGQPDVWLTHESGWTLSVYPSGLLLLENPDIGAAPGNLEANRETTQELWELLATGRIDIVLDQPWIPDDDPE